MARERFNRLRIATDDGVEFGLELAGPVSRFLAWILDFLIIIALSVALIFVGSWIAMLASLVSGGFLGDWIVALLFVGLFVVSIGYGIWMEWRWRGQTVGKRVLRLRVVDASGLRLTFAQVFIRNLLRFVDMLPGYYFVGGAVSALTRWSQRLGDLAAGTVVVRLGEAEAPPALRFEEGKFNTLREHPLVVARLRAAISPEEARLGWRALVRREMLDAAARVALYREIADGYRAHLRGLGEEVANLPDEALIRGVLDVVLERS